jgi:putative transcriptional regulator
MHDMHEFGMVSDEKMVKIESMYDSYKAPKYSAEMVKDIRMRFNLTQDTLATILNTSTSSVRQWEQGVKNPGGPSCKLLHLLDRKGLEAMRC